MLGDSMGDTTATASLRTVRRQRVIIVVTLVALVLSVSGLVASLFVKSPQQRMLEQQPPAPTRLTAAVQEKVLESTVVVRGTVEPVSAVPVAPVADEGPSIVTAINVKPGDSVPSGTIVAYVAGSPVVVLPGRIPSYRDLRPGSSGDDVKQLQTALVGFGHLGEDDVTGYFGPATSEAIEAWYETHGLSPTTTADLDPTEADTIAAARKDVTTAERALRTARSADPVDEMAMRTAEEDLRTAQERLDRLVAASGPIVRRSEVVFLPTLPVQVGEIQARVGDDLTSLDKPLMTLHSGGLVVRGIVPTGSETGIKAGQSVVVHDDINRRDAAATVTRLAEYRGPGGGTSDDDQDQGDKPDDPRAAPAGYPLVVTPSKPLTADWTGVDVRVTISLGRTKAPVLVVPQAAISTRADQTTIVRVAGTDDGLREVPVQVGLVSNGEVEVTPTTTGDLRAGDPVVVG